MSLDYSTISASPLSWPTGQPRVRSREFSRFDSKRTLSAATDGVCEQLRMMGARKFIVSTNLQLRRDGLPRSGQRMPDDPGVAVYFRLGDDDHVMACDRYLRLTDNMWAIAKTMEATRAIERYGVADLRQAFRGYKALPSPDECSVRHWWLVLGLPSATCSFWTAQAAYRKKLKDTHPDHGGSTERLMEVQQAWEHAKVALGEGR